MPLLLKKPLPLLPKRVPPHLKRLSLFPKRTPVLRFSMRKVKPQ
jgi:hypothetical protein